MNDEEKKAKEACYILNEACEKFDKKLGNKKDQDGGKGEKGEVIDRGEISFKIGFLARALDRCSEEITGVENHPCIDNIYSISLILLDLEKELQP